MSGRVVKTVRGSSIAWYVDAEVEAGALGTADPVRLHGADPLGPLDAVEPQQLLGIGGDLEEPLGEEAALDYVVRSLTAAVDDLLVGKHGVAAGTPVRGGLGPVGKALVVELEEPPLGPLVVVGVARDDFAVPVEAGTHQA